MDGRPNRRNKLRRNKLRRNKAVLFVYGEDKMTRVDAKFEKVAKFEVPIQYNSQRASLYCCLAGGHNIIVSRPQNKARFRTSASFSTFNPVN